jgi:hypothetical protein
MVERISTIPGSIQELKLEPGRAPWLRSTARGGSLGSETDELPPMAASNSRAGCSESISNSYHARVAELALADELAESAMYAALRAMTYGRFTSVADKLSKLFDVDDVTLEQALWALASETYDGERGSQEAPQEDGSEAGETPAEVNEVDAREIPHP